MTKIEKIELGIVIVHYLAYEETTHFCLAELSKISLPYVCVIVSNSSKIEYDELLAKNIKAKVVYNINESSLDEKTKYFVLPMEGNSGFAIGNNYGAEYLKRNYKDLKYILFSNNDIELASRNVVNELVNCLQSKKEIGIVGPAIIGLDGLNQSPHRFKGIIIQHIFPNLLYPVWNLLIKFNFVKKEVVISASEGYYYRIMGCFFIVSSDAFFKIGGFDENTFLYGEELILSERFRSIGLFTYYLPTVVVIHNHGSTTKNYFSELKIKELSNISLYYFYEKYRGVSTTTIRLAKLSFLFYKKVYWPLLKMIRS